MTPALNLVAVSGSVFAPSRTLLLVEALIEALAARLHIRSRIIRLREIAPETGRAFTRDTLPAHIDAQLQSIESAELLIVATPVYRGSISGQFKHVFDLLEADSLVNTPVLLAATGGSDRHALVVDHQLRPLFSFFQALTLPIGVYAGGGDFEDHRIASATLRERVALAADRAQRYFPDYLRSAPSPARPACEGQPSYRKESSISSTRDTPAIIMARDSSSAIRS